MQAVGEETLTCSARGPNPLLKPLCITNTEKIEIRLCGGGLMTLLCSLQNLCAADIDAFKVCLCSHISAPY